MAIKQYADIDGLNLSAVEGISVALDKTLAHLQVMAEVEGYDGRSLYFARRVIAAFCESVRRNGMQNTGRPSDAWTGWRAYKDVTKALKDNFCSESRYRAWYSQNEETAPLPEFVSPPSAIENATINTIMTVYDIDENSEIMTPHLQAALRMEAKAIISLDDGMGRAIFCALRNTRRWGRSYSLINLAHMNRGLSRRNRARFDALSASQRDCVMRRGVVMMFVYDLITEGLFAAKQQWDELDDYASFTEAEFSVCEGWCDSCIRRIPELILTNVYSFERGHVKDSESLRLLAGFIMASFEPRFKRALLSTQRNRYENSIRDGFNDIVSTVAVQLDGPIANDSSLLNEVGKSLRTFYGMGQPFCLPLSDVCDNIRTKVDCIEEWMAKDEARRLLTVAKSLLSPQEYAVMRLMVSHKEREIGIALNIKTGTVGAIKNRIRKKMKSQTNLIFSSQS